MSFVNAVAVSSSSRQRAVRSCGDADVVEISVWSSARMFWSALIATGSTNIRSTLRHARAFHKHATNASFGRPFATREHATNAVVGRMGDHRSMKSISCVFLRSSVLICAWPALLTQSATKPVVTSEIIVDYVAPPATLDEAVQAAAAIVIAAAETERTYQPPIDGASTRLICRMRVVNILRTHQALTAGEVDVYRMGGDTDLGDR
ncbi:MAG TPA: hypothetical protein VK137_08370, partial [Planctomycetaceae bacterium]|nr:hypothetical protein [Planctomycetaceae bacterium]